MKEYIEYMNLTDDEKKAAEFPGVTYSKTERKWKARGFRDRKRISLGTFSNPIDAKEAVVDFDRRQPEKANVSSRNRYISIVSTRPVSASGYRGVHRGHETRSWVANITVEGKTMNLGSYERIEDAVAARKEAENQYFKPYTDTFINQYPRYVNTGRNISKENILTDESKEDEFEKEEGMLIQKKEKGMDKPTSKETIIIPTIEKGILKLHKSTLQYSEYDIIVKRSKFTHDDYNTIIPLLSENGSFPFYIETDEGLRFGIVVESKLEKVTEDQELMKFIKNVTFADVVMKDGIKLHVYG